MNWLSQSCRTCPLLPDDSVPAEQCLSVLETSCSMLGDWKISKMSKQKWELIIDLSWCQFIPQKRTKYLRFLLISGIHCYSTLWWMLSCSKSKSTITKEDILLKYQHYGTKNYNGFPFFPFVSFFFPPVVTLIWNCFHLVYV